MHILMLFITIVINFRRNDLYDPSRQKIAYLRFYTDRTVRRLSLKYHECNILLKRNSLQLVKVIKYFENNNIEL